METRYLETLLAISRRGSLAGAAQHLNLTANAVAQRVRALENEFGARLVSRSGRTVSLTDAGHAVLARSEDFLREYRNLLASVTGSSKAGNLRIGAISTALTGLLPGVLSALSKSSPELRIFIESGTSSELYDRIQAGHLDAAIMIRPAFALQKAWQFKLWRRDPMVLLVPKSEKRKDVRAILRDWPYIQYDRQQWGGRLSQGWLERHNVEPEVRYEMDALDVIAVLVARGLGVSIVPDWVGPRPEGADFRRVPLPRPNTHRDIGFLFPRNAARTHLLRMVMEAAGLENRPRNASPGQ